MQTLWVSHHDHHCCEERWFAVPCIHTQRLVIWSVVQLLFKLVICCSWMSVDCLQVNTATELKTGLETKSYTRDLCVSMDLSPFIWRPACHWLSVTLCHNAVGNIAVLPFSNPSHGWWRLTDFSRKSVQQHLLSQTMSMLLCHHMYRV